MGHVLIAGVGMTRFGRHENLGYAELAAEAVTDALEHAGADRAQVQYAVFASCVAGFICGQHMVPGHVALRKMGFEGIPIFNVEGACASASSAMQLADQAIRSGDCDIALAVGTEKMMHPDKKIMFAAFDLACYVSCVEQNRDALLKMGEGVAIPEGSQSDAPYSMFMDVYAA